MFVQGVLSVLSHPRHPPLGCGGGRELRPTVEGPSTLVSSRYSSAQGTPMSFVSPVVLGSPRSRV